MTVLLQAAATFAQPEGLPMDTVLPPIVSDASASLPAAEAAQESTVSLSHRLELTSVMWLARMSNDVDPWWGELEYSPRFTWKPLDSLALTADFLLRFARAKRSRHLSGNWDGAWVEYDRAEVRSQRDRQYVAPRELFVAWTGGLDVAVGWQVISWSRSDGIRPLDVFQRQDSSDRLRSETLGVPAVTAGYGRDEWAFDAVWVPSSSVDRNATDERNPWALLPQATIPATFDSNPPEVGLHNGEAGLRFSYAGQAWDASVLAAYTRDRSPSYLALTPNPSTNGLRVRPEYLQQWAFGASFAVPLGTYLARADVLYARYLEPREPLIRHGVRGVAGVERRGELASHARYSAILQYAIDTTSPGRPTRRSNLTSSPTRFYQHAVTLFASLAWREQLELEARLLAELERQSGLASLVLRYRPMDGLAFWAGVDLLRGSDESWLGRMQGKRRALLGVEIYTQ